MIDPINDPLADRLKTMTLETPLGLVDRALARGREERKPRSGLWRPVRLATAVVGIFLVLTGLGCYLAPRFAEALAETPFVGAPVGDLLRGIGMARIPGQITTLDDSATDAGVRIRLVGGYADAFQTVLIVNIQDPERRGPGVMDATVTDQFGRSYEQRAGSWSIANPGSVDQVIIFAPLQWPSSWTGARLTLHIHSLQPTPPAIANINGSWVLHGTLTFEDARTLARPQDGKIDSTTFHFIAVRTTPAALEVHMVVEGPMAARLSDVGHIAEPASQFKPQPNLSIELVDPDGLVQMEIGGQTYLNGNRDDLTWLWVAPRSGRYQLVVRYLGVGSFTRQIVVP